MFRLKIVVIQMLMLIPAWAFAQKTITGTVTSATDGSAIPMATVSVKGSSNGTVTNIDGQYSIQANTGDILRFAFVGYSTQEKSVETSNTIDIQLLEKYENIDEVVVIGYGTEKKRNVTGAVSQISSKDFEQRNVASMSEALAGTMSGVQVSSTSGAPGSGAFVSIRGVSSLNDNSVLWVVDGMPLKSIDYLNPRDIESVQVLKDASAAAIYGAQGANGVIIIETKKGKMGHLQVDFSSQYGLQLVARNPQLADATEYALMQNQAAINDGKKNLPFDDPMSMGAGTNWWEAATQQAPMHEYYLSLSKGEENYNISSSLSYFGQDGVLKGGGYNRVTFRLNTDYKLGDKVTVGENIVISNQNTRNGLDDWMVWDAMRLEPTTPIYLPEYEQAGLNEFSIFSPTLTDISNLVGQLARNFSTSNSMRTVGNAFFDYNPTSYLNFRSEFGVEIENWTSNWYSPNYYIEEMDKNDENSVGSTLGHKFLYNWNNILTYNKQFDNHKVGLMGAVTTRSDKWDAVTGSGRNIPNNHPDLRFLSATTSAWNAGSSNSHITSFSMLGRLSYDYKSKYLLTSSFRRDGSSKFPTNNKWANFASVSAGWILSEEDFLKDVDWLSFLKLRGAWGQIGNDNIPYDAQFTTIDNYYYILGWAQSLTLGKAAGTVGNTNLIWETVEDMNIGVDASFFKGKLSIGIDAFNRTSKDMLMQKALLSYMGSGFGRQWANIGSMNSRGVDFDISHKNVMGAWRYDIGLNLSHASSKMTELADGEAIWEGNDQRLGMLTYTGIGGPVGAFYGFVTDGIFQNEIDINNHSDDSGNVLQPTAKPGDFKFKDLNGDGKITADGDRTIIGSPEALFSFGLNLQLNYRSFDLKMLITGTYGNEVLTPIWAYTHSGSSNYNSYKGLIYDAWSGEGTSDTQPRIANVDANQNFRYSDFYVSDGSYARLKSLQIGYELPDEWYRKLNIDKLRVYVSAENLFTLTGYEGLDPDMGPFYSNILLRGVNWGNYPLPRIMFLGLSVSL
ncbi:MAG: TonB-dependent receptor [Bacteroidetes bacterium]|jgi:TonB-dependent starch-binding outer membrane protein SusC|nr:TonB-dependent receptor [Bacteroidota bacterium]MBT3750704.1 TonB-dependent receptor [Bacteroidota bacterium]MBT4408448.1 TonB-dependent receptor [Bacteroidota bacterium]MBT5427131.1 TonB-dependent receptor [Bacteroidota bacterium]MBT7465794.1 TonB-dependent receptor [Bacteroidota bacterium]